MKQIGEMKTKTNELKTNARVSTARMKLRGKTEKYTAGQVAKYNRKSYNPTSLTII